MDKSISLTAVVSRFLTALLFVVALNNFVPDVKGEVGLFPTKQVEMPSFFK
jgi:hypothetical protein